MLVLMVGIQPQKKPGNMIDMLGLCNGMLMVFSCRKISTFCLSIPKYPGLYCAGGITGPKTIEETLTEARAVAAEISAFPG